MTHYLSFLACSTCRVNMIEGGRDAAGWSIFALLIIILAMLCAVVFFMFRLARRERLNFDAGLAD